MKKIIALAIIAAVVAGAAAGTTMMLRDRNDPPAPPPDPRPCLAQARRDGMTREHLEILSRVGREPITTIEAINLREDLRGRELPACEWTRNALEHRSEN